MGGVECRVRCGRGGGEGSGMSGEERGKEGSHPVVDARADHHHLCTCVQGLAQGSEALGTQEMMIVSGKATAAIVEVVQ